MPASVRWHPEEQRNPDGSVRRVQAAWLVAEPTEAEPRRRYLAYLGNSPHLTQQVRDECQVLYPEVEIDWGAVARALEHPPPIEGLDLETLAQRWTQLAANQGLDPMEVEIRIGGGWKRPLSNLARLLSDSAAVARMERTSGSILAYMLEFHADYAYALAKLGLLMTGQHTELEQLEAREATELKGAPRTRQVEFWRASAERIATSLNT